MCFWKSNAFAVKTRDWSITQLAKMMSVDSTLSLIGLTTDVFFFQPFCKI